MFYLYISVIPLSIKGQESKHSRLIVSFLPLVIVPVHGQNRIYQVKMHGRHGDEALLILSDPGIFSLYQVQDRRNQIADRCHTKKRGNRHIKLPILAGVAAA